MTNILNVQNFVVNMHANVTIALNVTIEHNSHSIAFVPIYLV